MSEKEASREEQQARQGELADLREILRMPSGAGRRFLWRLLDGTRVFESIMEPSSKIYYNAGRQDVGHQLLFEINEADPNAWIEMMRENHKRTLEADVERRKKEAKERHDD